MDGNHEIWLCFCLSFSLIMIIIVWGKKEKTLCSSLSFHSHILWIKGIKDDK